eukprot:COSAG01_NODE_2473_length_7623_cov_17.832137_1_plen_52_part_10
MFHAQDCPARSIILLFGLLRGCCGRRLLSQQYSEDNVREILSSLQALLKADL